MRAGRRARAGDLALAVVIVGTAASAHRRDEFLQAARLGVEPDRVELELDLTPGIAVADATIADIDRDRDGVLSAEERGAYSVECSTPWCSSSTAGRFTSSLIAPRFPASTPFGAARE